MSEARSPARSLFIKDLIRRVHKELIESQAEREAAGEEPLFTVQDMTIEAHFVVQESKAAEGGVDFRLLTFGGARAGGKKEAQQQQVHKIVLRLRVAEDAPAATRPRRSAKRRSPGKRPKKAGVRPR